MVSCSIVWLYLMSIFWFCTYFTYRLTEKFESACCTLSFLNFLGVNGIKLCCSSYLNCKLFVSTANISACELAFRKLAWKSFKKGETTCSFCFKKGIPSFKKQDYSTASLIIKLRLKKLTLSMNSYWLGLPYFTNVLSTSSRSSSSWSECT